MKRYNEVLSVENLKKIYDNGKLKTVALKGINIKLKSSEMLGIMGTSGSGKSTLLNIIGALDEPTTGEIYINGKLIENYHEEPYATKYRSEYIGFIFQGYNLLKDLNVEDNIALPLLLRGVSDKEIKISVMEIIDQLGLSGLENKRPVELSGGQQQRVAIGRALISKPKVLLADEPTGNLDYNTSKELLRILKDMQKKFNQSIILVTHDPKVGSYADRTLFMHDGEIVDEYISRNDEHDLEEILKKFKLILEKKND